MKLRNILLMVVVAVMPLQSFSKWYHKAAIGTVTAGAITGIFLFVRHKVSVTRLNKAYESLRDIYDKNSNKLTAEVIQNKENLKAYLEKEHFYSKYPILVAWKSIRLHIRAIIEQVDMLAVLSKEIKGKYSQQEIDSLASSIKTYCSRLEKAKNMIETELKTEFKEQAQREQADSEGRIYCSCSHCPEHSLFKQWLITQVSI